MESQLQRDSKRAMQCEEEKSQLEEAIRKLQQDIRDMRNTSEKYTASIQVRIPEPSPASAPHRPGCCQGALKDRIPAHFCVPCRVFLNKKPISKTKSKNSKLTSLLLLQTKPNRRSWKKSLMVIKKVQFVERGLERKVVVISLSNRGRNGFGFVLQFPVLLWDLIFLRSL